MNYDYIHLALWLVVGMVMTWGIFLAWVGFRGLREDGKKPQLASVGANFALVIGILWIIIWVSMVAVNIIQIVGDPSWHPLLPPSRS